MNPTGSAFRPLSPQSDMATLVQEEKLILNDFSAQPENEPGRQKAAARKAVKSPSWEKGGKKRSLFRVDALI